MRNLILIFVPLLTLSLNNGNPEILKHRSWLLYSIYDPGIGRQFIFNDEYPLAFTDSTLHGTACNSFWTNCKIEENEIKFVGIAITDHGCFDEESELFENYVLKHFRHLQYKATPDTLQLTSSSKVVFTYYSKK